MKEPKNEGNEFNRGIREGHSHLTSILIMCMHPIGAVPGQRLRWELYLEYLRSKNFRIHILPFYSRQGSHIMSGGSGNWLQKISYVLWGMMRRLWQMQYVAKVDIVFVGLHVTPIGGSLFESMVRALAKKYIHDIDDLLYAQSFPVNNFFMRLLRSPDKYFYQFKKADHVITSSSYILAKVKQFNNSATLIPIAVDTTKYRPRKISTISDLVVLGWSGSFSTSPYLLEILDVLKKLKESLRFKLLIIGSKNIDIGLDDVEYIPFNLETEVQDLQRIDIGLYPLPHTEWVLGKGGGKAIQYQAIGIPVVAEAIGENFNIIQDNKSGFLVNSKAQWESCLRRLISDKQLRLQMGRQARATVEHRFSTSVVQASYLNIFQNP